MATLADLLRLEGGAFVGYPQMPNKTVPQPQGGYAEGFLSSATGIPQQPNMSVLDPNQATYLKGRQAGEPVGIAAMALPFAAPAAVATAKALAPKAGMMAENYMARKGMMPSVLPQNPVNQITNDLTLPNDYNKLSTMATEAYAALRKTPNKQTHDYYKMLMDARDNATLNNPKNVKDAFVPAVADDYKGQHQAPMMDSGKPLFDLTDIYPDDFYSSKAVQYYGTGSPNDYRVISQLQSLRNKPNEPVWMYRAVPKDAESVINKGDWVTIDRQYAKEHGENALKGEFKIIKRKASARDLFTNGDSPFEMGYDPQPRVSRKATIKQQIDKIE
jgi:hypothetical protein